MRRLMLLGLLGMLGCAHLFTNKVEDVQRIGWRRQVLHDLDSLWTWSRDEQTELAFCLYGTLNITGHALAVREARAPVREVSLQTNAATVECQASDMFLGIAHTHPSGNGEPSKTDLAQLNKMDLVTVVCGPGCRTSWLYGHVLPIERVPR
jgi:proteasome lid subunit RPN8/RPN11